MPKGQRGPRPVEVTKPKAKQSDLPSMEASSRKIGEIEDLADELEAVTSTRVSWSNKEKDAMDNLVASMKRHNRVAYIRQSWGKVILKEGKTKAKVEKDGVEKNEED